MKGKMKVAKDVVHCEPKKKGGKVDERKDGGKVDEGGSKDDVKAYGAATTARADRAPRKRGGSVGSPLSMPQIAVNKNPQKTKNY